MEEVRKVRSGKVAAAFAVLLVVSFAVMNTMPSDTLSAALLQEAVLALVAIKEAMEDPARLLLDV